MWSLFKPNLPMVIGMLIAGAAVPVIAFSVLVCMVLIPAPVQAPAAPRVSKVWPVLKDFRFQIGALFLIAMVAVSFH